MPTPGIDHVAFPCFDVRASHEFYADVLGLPLVHAETGSAEAWGAREYLLVVYALPLGGVIDFFSFTGIRRPPPDGLPKDIRHVAMTLPTRGDVVAYREKLERAKVPFWLETHGADDLHVYTTDPNGVVLELLAPEDGAAARPTDPDGARRAVLAWIDREEPR